MSTLKPTTHCPRCDDILVRTTQYGFITSARYSCRNRKCSYRSSVVLMVNGKTGVKSDGRLRELKNILGTTEYSKKP